jgi:hypothetical protein
MRFPTRKSVRISVCDYAMDMVSIVAAGKRLVAPASGEGVRAAAMPAIGMRRQDFYLDAGRDLLRRSRGSRSMLVLRPVAVSMAPIGKGLNPRQTPERRMEPRRVADARENVMPEPGA